MTTCTLSLDEVVIAVGDKRLLDGISLQVAPGRIVAVIGANGAGKTTLLDAISGVMPLASGRVDVTRSATGDVAASPVGRCFQGSPLPETMTVAEVLSLVTRSQADAEAMLARFGLTSYSSRFIAELSTGMRRVVDVAVATAKEPTVLLLDEPASGMAVTEVEHLADLITGWRDASGGSVILVEHDQGLVRKVADEVIVLEAGRVVASGAPDEILVGASNAEAVFATGAAPAEVGPRTKRRARPSTGTGRSRRRARADAPHAPAAVAAAASPTSPTDAPSVWANNTAAARVRRHDDPEFRAALAKIGTDASPPAIIERRVLSTWTLLRLGLREFAAGMGSVLILGVLNRVMKVELGISLLVVACVLSSYNLAAPLALAVGHRSDTHPIFGQRRVPYIIGGSILTGLTVAAAPHAAGLLEHGINPISIGASLLLFTAMGLGMYGSGTVFFALLADLAPARERGHAASIVYFELMFGILAGVVLTTTVIDDHANGLSSLFALVGVLIVAFTTLAVWGTERRIPAAPADAPAEEHVGFIAAIKGVAAIRQARLFFIFMVASTLFLFLQQAVLEPFGGEVLGLSVRQTSAFNAVMTVGILAGMFVAGRQFAQRLGHHKMAVIGLVAGVGSFAFLALAAAAGSAPPSWIAIFGVGLATGAFNVSALAMMMGMADGPRTALFMGAWTTAHALADGAATAGGGVVFEITHAITSSVPGGYAMVFAVEAVGLVACLPLLRAINPERFRAELTGELPELQENHS